MPRKKTIKEVAETGRQIGLTLLSKNYSNNKSPLLWQCPLGHKFLQIYNVVQQKLGCPYCSHHRYFIDDLHQLAKRANLTFVGQPKMYLWQCACGHKFSASPCHIKNRKGCPICSRNSSEERCRHIFEQLVGSPFVCTRKILDGLELDGYNKPILVAFEHQGIQHYDKNHRWNDNVIERDIEKRKLCKKFGIKQMEIPYWENKTNATLEKFNKNTMAIKGGNID